MSRAEQYLSRDELEALGLAECGRHVFISRQAVISFPANVRIGNMVRIDAFTSLSGNKSIEIGDHVHLGTGVAIHASAPVRIGNYSGLSAGVKLFTTDDDYSGMFLTGPTIPPEFTQIRTGAVTLEEHCVVGANSVILSGVTLGEGVAVGALSLVKDDLPAWGIYGGVPARQLGPRSRELLKKVESLYPPVPAAENVDDPS